MQPKFQSSFIPKGPSNTTSIPQSSLGRRKEGGGVFSFLANLIVGLTLLLAVGVFGYKLFLNYSISNMAQALEEQRVNVQPHVVREITRINTRIVSSESLIARHRVLTPFFEMLQANTPRTVRFSDFEYNAGDRGIELAMRGEARGYAAVAQQAEIFERNQYIVNPIFSDLRLDESGNVSFVFKATVNPDLVSYSRMIEVGATSSTFPAGVEAGADVGEFEE